MGSRKKIHGAETRVARGENAISGVPDLRVTLPSEDEVSIEASNSQKLDTKTHKSLNNDKFSTPRSSSRNAEASKKPSDHSLQRPRTFFLSASSTATSLSRRRAIDDFQDLTSRRNEPPVFVEGEKQSSRSLESHMIIVEAETAPDQTRNVSHESVEDASSEIGVREAGGGCRLKPGQRSSASLEKQKPRDDSGVKPATIRNSTLQKPKLSQSASTPSNEWDYESMALAEELHQIALEETAKYAETQNDKCYSKRLKFKPKPPKERLRGHQPTEHNPSGDDAMDGVQYSESENEEFVYDTYVRKLDQATNSPDTSTLEIDEMEAANNRSIGIIVIGEHEQEIWETFGEEDESNKDWNSEEEDENGKYCPPRNNCSRRATEQ